MVLGGKKHKEISILEKFPSKLLKKKLALEEAKKGGGGKTVMHFTKMLIQSMKKAHCMEQERGKS